jgi:hypothetical protein
MAMGEAGRVNLKRVTLVVGEQQHPARNLRSHDFALGSV